MTLKKNEKKLSKLIKAPVKLSLLKDIDISSILSSFSIKRKSEYSLPRITFIGYFGRLSLTDQRHITKTLGFEYDSGIKFGDTSGESLQKLAGNWSKIYKETRLIVLGNRTITGWEHGIPEMDWASARHLFRCYKKRTQPIFVENNIPIIMESELLKLHPEYPNINNSTRWDGRLNIDVTPKGLPKQGNLMDLV